VARNEPTREGEHAGAIRSGLAGSRHSGSRHSGSRHSGARLWRPPVAPACGARLWHRSR
jgi:hypothetical protein